MFNIYYYKHPKYTVGKEIVQTVDTEQEASRFCNIYNRDGGYEDNNGKKHFLDYEDIMSKEAIEEMDNTEIRKITYTECHLKCVSCEALCDEMPVGQCKKNLIQHYERKDA